MMMEWKLASTFLIASTLLAAIPGTVANSPRPARRAKCVNRDRIQVYDGHDSMLHQRLTTLRNEMRTRPSTQSVEVDAYLVTPYDEHMSDHLMESDQRLQFISGFTGKNAQAVVTLKSAALWVDPRYYDQAEYELNCDWRIFRNDDRPNLAEWISGELKPESKVGADPQLVPHSFWITLERQLNSEFIKLVKINRNLIDLVWGPNRPAPKLNSLKVHPLRFAGERWESKVNKLRSNFTSHRCDAMIVTSLTEIAYILNLRGSDIPYTPVFKAYLLVSNREIILYTNKTRISMGLINHLKSHNCHNEYCVSIKEYEDVRRDLQTLSQHWKRILVPSAVVFDLGASEAIHSALPRGLVLDKPSPIIFLRAQKNEIEKEGMKKAHIRDGVAMCEVLSFLESRFLAGDTFTELLLAREIDRSRKIQNLSEGTSFETIVAFGSHSAIPHYTPSNLTDFEITEHNTLLIDSGGQYQDGTTDVSRTIHLGEPSPEQIRAYTNVLIGMIRLSVLIFPENLQPAELDALARGPVWGEMNDYPHGTGHGIGSYLSVHESPINVAYTTKQRYGFKEGYFFSNGLRWCLQY
ncbi:xaa-Pro aminopeptidase 2 isoform X2 [Toxorhynchites rutilus septentrionalis]|uniref:xaa-Pro aminopeptidase 2 isoform X2 n=1 Tax=Toxorhynchites rutilus septentrionalis TaxID=329112 RepID=UPI0024797AAA|nr:xaa-Pro aminopeptidase 2 isoform X2 [Toxorhynchites rutilus septentrionalis]